MYRCIVTLVTGRRIPSIHPPEQLQTGWLVSNLHSPSDTNMTASRISAVLNTTDREMSPCQCCMQEENSSTTLLPPFRVTTSELSISMKEIVILSMIFFLLIYSVLSFLTHWKKNYRDISHHSQYCAALTSTSSQASLLSEEQLSRAESRMSRIVRVRSRPQGFLLGEILEIMNVK